MTDDAFPDSRMPAGRTSLVAVALAAALSALFCLLWLGRQPFTDEGSVCHLAVRLLEGRTLYSGAWNEKTPLHFVLAALWSRAFGATITSLRGLAAFDLFLVLLLTLRVAGRARWGAVATLLLLAPWYQAHHGVQEATLAPLALATMWAASSGTSAGWLAAGALGATGVWVKQSFATIFLALAGEHTRMLVRIAMAALAMSLLWLALLWLHAGDGLWRMPPFGEREAALPYFLGGWSEDRSLLLAHMLAVVGVLWASRRGERDDLTRRLAAAALWLALPALLRPGAFRAWPSAVVAIVAGARVIAAMPSSARRRVGAVVLAFVSIAGVARIAIDDGDYSVLERVSARVAELATEDEHIWVGPHEALIYCLANRTSATSIDFALPWAPSPAARAALLVELEADPPRVIVDASGPYEPWQGRLSDSLPGINDLLASRYRKVETVDGFDLYRRLDPDSERSGD